MQHPRNGNENNNDEDDIMDRCERVWRLVEAYQILPIASLGQYVDDDDRNGDTCRPVGPLTRGGGGILDEMEWVESQCGRFH